MTGFDNGPENGDFVRYIDALSASRAATPASRRDVAFERTDAATRPAAAASRGVALVAPTGAVSTARSDALAAAMARGSEVARRPLLSVVAVVIGFGLIAAAFVGATLNVALLSFGALLVYFAFARFVNAARSIIGSSAARAASTANRKP